jgi:hypothetical protein
MLPDATCTLCLKADCPQYCSDAFRHYYQCRDCGLIFVPPAEYVSLIDEKKRYSLHDNTFDNLDYRTYLAEYSREIRRIPINQPSCLDFGSGQHRVLEKILREQGIDCSSYDPLYEIGLEVQAKTYDVIFCCEVLEHLRDLSNGLALMRKLIRRSGYLILRTQLLTPEIAFEKWWYKEDKTHINFFSAQTIQKIAGIINGQIFYANQIDTVIVKA